MTHPATLLLTMKGNTMSVRAWRIILALFCTLFWVGCYFGVTKVNNLVHELEQLRAEKKAWQQYNYRPSLSDKSAGEIIGDLVRTAVNGEEIPKIIRPKDVPVDKIPPIVAPSIGGLVEIARGCGRGCRFCLPNMRRVKYFSKEQKKVKQKKDKLEAEKLEYQQSVERKFNETRDFI